MLELRGRQSSVKLSKCDSVLIPCWISWPIVGLQCLVDSGRCTWLVVISPYPALDIEHWIYGTCWSTLSLRSSESVTFTLVVFSVPLHSPFATVTLYSSFSAIGTNGLRGYSVWLAVATFARGRTLHGKLYRTRQNSFNLRVPSSLVWTACTRSMYTGSVICSEPATGETIYDPE